MNVKLLVDIREGIQVSALGKITNPGQLKVSVRKGLAYPMAAGRVVSMSDASAQKYIGAKVAEASDEPASPGIPHDGPVGASLSAA